MSKDLVALGIERESGQTAERSGGDLQVDMRSPDRVLDARRYA